MTPRLELRGIRKAYPGVVANDDISLSVAPGEIHGIVGENGAGKSTLMKIIYGATKADAGEILCDGRTVPDHGPALSRKLGIEMVYQHFALFETLSVVENVALSMAGRMDLPQLSQTVREVSYRYGLPVDPRALVQGLSVGERQRVEIIRCLLRKPRLLILDEPSSVLTPQAVQKLFETLRQLAEEGCSILYISHKLDEVRDLCQTATVLRGGRVTGSADPRTVSTAELARMMVGATLPKMRATPADRSAAPLLQVDALSLEAPSEIPLSSVSLSAYGGEIIGIAGVSGNGQNTLAAALSGELRAPGAADVRLKGAPIGHLGAGARRDLHLGFVPEERLGRGAVPSFDLAANALLTGHRDGMVAGSLVRRRSTQSYAQKIIDRFTVKANGAGDVASGLSGGNLQKFIMGREIALEPEVLIVSQPTWGVDVGAAAYLRQTLIDLSRAGKSVIVISEDLEELFEICDRLYVMSQGQLSEPLISAETSVEAVGLLMAGARSQEPVDAL